jgi:hypothetical protein
LESQLVAAQKQAIQKLLLGENQEQAINRVKRLQTAVDTRWSSFYRMLERICVLKDALISLGEEDLDYIHLDDEGQPTTASSNIKKNSKIKDIMLTNEEFGVVTKLLDTLHRFELMTTHAQSQSCSLSEIPPFVKKSRLELKNIKGLSKFTQSLRKSLKERLYFSYSDEVLFAVSTDPRYKNLDCLIDEKINDNAALPTKARELLRNAVYEEARIASTSSGSTELKQNNTNINQNNSQYCKILSDEEASLLFDLPVKDRSLNNETMTHPLKANEEIQSWFNAKIENISTSTDPIDWWRHNHQAYPLISRVARRVLSIPASS